MLTGKSDIINVKFRGYFGNSRHNVLKYGQKSDMFVFYAELSDNMFLPTTGSPTCLPDYTV